MGMEERVGGRNETRVTDSVERRVYSEGEEGIAQAKDLSGGVRSLKNLLEETKFKQLPGEHMDAFMTRLDSYKKMSEELSKIYLEVRKSMPDMLGVVTEQEQRRNRAQERALGDDARVDEMNEKVRRIDDSAEKRIAELKKEIGEITEIGRAHV